MFLQQQDIAVGLIKAAGILATMYSLVFTLANLLT
jgi:hypothetical protein